DFLVVWTSPEPTEPLGNIFAQRYSSSGSPMGGNFRVNTYSTSSQGQVRVADASNGDFLVVWQSFGVTNHIGIFGQRYDSQGAALGGEFAISSNTASGDLRLDPRAAYAADGSFVAVWDEDPQDNSGKAILARRFTSAGAPIGIEFQVNTYTTGN